jgi:hypothetical protein
LPRLSVNPGNEYVYVCINVLGEAARELPTSVCSASVQPVDSWRFISVDAVALNDHITVIMGAMAVATGANSNSFVAWDDAYRGRLLSCHDYSNARNGVNSALSPLIPAIVTAGALNP